MRVTLRESLFLCASFLGASALLAQVTPQRLLDSDKEPQNWLMYSGDYAGHRFSALDQINASNAAALVPKWAYQTMAGGKFEATPLVVDGVLYATGQDNRAFALDARTGRPIW
jgi:alcohol dehydrogenase (cytochrome c)